MSGPTTTNSRPSSENTAHKTHTRIHLTRATDEFLPAPLSYGAVIHPEQEGPPHMPQKIVPNLWFDTEAEEAANFYVSVFKNSRVLSVKRYPEGAMREAGQVMTVEWELDGERFVGINGGPQFKFTEAVSLQISCETQDEIDYYWERLSAGGDPKAQQCGWLKDKFGVSWQVVPVELMSLLKDPDPGRAQRATEAMLSMRRIDIAAIKQAADQVPA